MLGRLLVGEQDMVEGKSSSTLSDGVIQHD